MPILLPRLALSQVTWKRSKLIRYKLLQNWQYYYYVPCRISKSSRWGIHNSRNIMQRSKKIPCVLKLFISSIKRSDLEAFYKDIGQNSSFKTERVKRHIKFEVRRTARFNQGLIIMFNNHDKSGNQPLTLVLYKRFLSHIVDSSWQSLVTSQASQGPGYLQGTRQEIFGERIILQLYSNRECYLLIQKHSSHLSHFLKSHYDTSERFVSDNYNFVWDEKKRKLPKMYFV